MAGAFHTQLHGSPPSKSSGSTPAPVYTHDARTRLLSNADGAVVQSGREYLNRLVVQVSNPVRWDLCMHTMRDLGVTALIEVPPAGTLAGLAKRALPGIEIVALKTPDDLDAARDLVERHGSAQPDVDTLRRWRMLVAPAKGMFHHARRQGRRRARARDQSSGDVVTNRDEQTVVAPHGGTIVEWLVEDGDPVAPGQPLVRLHPHEVTS